MTTKQLPEDYALVLQQIEADGGDAFEDLAETLRFDRRRLAHILQALHHKGLIVMRAGSGGHEAWLSLTTRGRRLMNYLWPESGLMPGY